MVFPQEATGRTCGCTGDLGAVGSEFTAYSSVPVILDDMPSTLRHGDAHDGCENW
jgi:hypothetical protein